MRFAKQRDANEQLIVDSLRAAGCAVAKLDSAGVPDLIVSYRSRLEIVEVKNPMAKGGGKYNTGDGALTSAQTKWLATWAAAGGRPPIVVTTVDEALRAIVTGVVE